jgi:hypothetical protein
VLGKAKVISYKDLEEARAKRVVKDSIKEAKGKGKRGQKRKRATLKVKEATINKVKRGRKRKSAMLEAEAKAEAKELKLEPSAKMARISKVLALSRALVMQILITKDKIILKL